MTDLAGARVASTKQREPVGASLPGLTGFDGAGVRDGAAEGAVRWPGGYLRRALLVDVVTAVVVGVFAVVLPVGNAPVALRMAVAVALPVVWVATLFVCRGYERRYLGTTTEEYRAVARSALALVAALVLGSWVLHAEISRGLVLVVFAALLVGGLLARNALRRSLQRRRSAGLDMQRTVVVGSAASVAGMIRQLDDASGAGMKVVGACVSGIDSGGDFATELEGVPVFGYPAEAMHAIDLLDAEVVAVSNDHDLSGHELRRLAWSLEERAVELIVATGLFDVAGPRLSIRPVAGMPMLHVERPVMAGVRRAAKRVVDWLGALAIVVLALPLFVAVAVAIRLDSKGPILFRQERVGARGVTFPMFKFRSMVVDAEARLAEVTATADAGNTVQFKMKKDPRITRVGGFLRRFSIDELPQLLNVLRGEMSLIGPRPPLPREVATYESDAVRRLHVRPGLTGLWQVSGRSNLSWDESLRLDLWYVDNWSVVLDLQIIARTVRAVVRGTGAY